MSLDIKIIDTSGKKSKEMIEEERLKDIEDGRKQYKELTKMMIDFGCDPLSDEESYN